MCKRDAEQDLNDCQRIHKTDLLSSARARTRMVLFGGFFAAIFTLVLMASSNDQVAADYSQEIVRNPTDIQRAPDLIPKAAQTYSTDAILVYEKSPGIYYSIYGHNPAIPTPVTQTVTWTWWSIDGSGASDIATPTRSLSTTSETLSRPDVAFSREGNASAVWAGVALTGVYSCTDPIGNPNFFPRYRGGIRTAQLAEQSNGDFLWNGTPNIDPPANTTTEDQYYHNPSIAFDNNGTAIVVYIYTKVTYSNPCSIAAEMKVLSRRWDGSNWVDETIIAGPELTWCSPPNGTPYLSYHCEHYTDIAFTARLATEATPNTRQQAIAVWYDLIDIPSVSCPGPGSGPVPLFWPKYSVWNGASWTASAEIPGRPQPPYMKFVDGKLGISTDQFENARLVFPVVNEPDPCTASDETYQVRDSNWSGKATQAWTSAVVLQNGRPPDVAVLQDNTSIDVHTAIDLSGIKWATADISGTWTAQGDLSTDSSSKNPTIAALHTPGSNIARAVTVWSAGDGLRWSMKSGASAWTASAILDAGSGDHPEIAAHTGSPGLPHAEWTLGMYETRDENGGSLKTSYIQNQLQAFGSTALVNAVGMSEDNSSAAAYRYYKLGANTLRRNVGATDVGSPNNVRDFVAWFVEHYPSRRTLVEFEDHGTPWTGCCFDRAPQNNLALSEINAGLTATGQNLNIILFRCCMMGTVETAYSVRQRANFMVASQDWVDTPLATNGNGGFRNDCLLRPSNPLAVPVATPCGVASNGLGLVDDPFRSDRTIVSDTVTIYKNTNDNQTTRDHTLSAIDLSQVGTPTSAGTLMNRISLLANALNTNFTGNEAAIRAAVDNSERFVESWNTISLTKTNQPRAAGMRDLRGFAQNLNADGGLPLAVRNAAADVSTAVSNTVVAYWGDDMHRVGDANAGALQVYGLNIWVERTKVVYNNQSAAYNALAFETDLVAVGANNSWSAFVNRAAQSTGVLMLLDSPSADLFMRAGLATGEQVGGVDPAHDCGGYCASNIGDATCIDNNAMELIWMPNTHPAFTWYLDGAAINTTTSYTLTFQVVLNGSIAYQYLRTGGINPGQIISGTYPANSLYLPLVIR